MRDTEYDGRIQKLFTTVRGEKIPKGMKMVLEATSPLRAKISDPVVTRIERSVRNTCITVGYQPKSGPISAVADQMARQSDITAN